MVTKKKKKEKKPSGTRDKNISNHRPGEKRKNVIGQKKKKEKTNPVTPVEKNQEMCSQLVKRKLKPVVNAAMPQRVLHTSGANNKINLKRQSEFSY